jgi:uncharacterized membrane protein YhaH (DUF805 family)
MLQHAIFPVFMMFMFHIPFTSIFLSPFFIIFIRKGSEIDRTQFQNKLFLWLGLAIIISVFGKLGYLGTYIQIPKTTAGGELQMSSMNIGVIGTVLIPSILYSICVRNAAKRLRGMGYNRFSSLLTVIPFIGPAVLIWLAFTIAEKKQKYSA